MSDARSTQPSAATGSDRQIFQIDCAAATDALVRVLSPFSILAVELVTVSSRRNGDRLVIQIETQGLPLEQVQHLRHRLQAMPSIDGVGIGWRT